jgi:hypothetical protein
MTLRFERETVVTIAHLCLGSENKALSGPDELRFGSNGSVAVRLDQACWYDWERDTSGGMLALIRERRGHSGQDAIQWLRGHGVDIADDKSEPPNLKKIVADRFDYEDESGKLLFQVERVEFQNSDGFFVLTDEGKRKKTFRQRRPNPAKLGGWIWNLAGVKPIPYRLPELLDAVVLGQLIIVAEGERKVDLLRKWNVAATCCAGGAQKWLAEHSAFLQGADVVILPDNDEAGHKHAVKVAASLFEVGASVRVLELPGLGPKSDVVDWAKAGGTPEQLHELIAREGRPWSANNGHDLESDTSRDRNAAELPPRPEQWPEPKPIPEGLPPVAAFEVERFLPASIAPWVRDIANRMQCLPAFVGVAAMAVLGSVLGRKIGVRPKQRDSWTCASNFWALVVGTPGSIKSPSIEEVLKPISRLEGLAAQTYAAEMAHFKNVKEFHELQKEDAKKLARNKRDRPITLDEFVDAQPLPLPPEPTERRYKTNDPTYEKLGVILAENPNGVLVHRDEMVTLLRHLDKEEQVSARGFFMTAWNGTGSYKFDRITRGTVHIEHLCLSLLGATTPSALAGYMASVHKDAGGDGLMQRFNLMVWPDRSPNWLNVDEWPDTDARARAWAVFDRLDQISPQRVDAEEDPYAGPGLGAGDASRRRWRRADSRDSPAQGHCLR